MKMTSSEGFVSIAQDGNGHKAAATDPISSSVAPNAAQDNPKGGRRRESIRSTYLACASSRINILSAQLRQALPRDTGLSRSPPPVRRARGSAPPPRLCLSGRTMHLHRSPLLLPRTVCTHDVGWASDVVSDRVCV